MKHIIKKQEFVIILLNYLMPLYILLDLNMFIYLDILLRKKLFFIRKKHAWSLIKINGKWLPFDAIWGIFTGKLPICLIFYSYFFKRVKKNENVSDYL